MNEKIINFIEDLRRQLQGIPDQEINEAVGYYEEYLNGADEAGKDIDEILLSLGSPDKIASMIRAEVSIAIAQQSPGLKNFASVLKNAFHGVTTPFKVFLLSIVIVISFSIVAVFFAGSLVVLIGTLILGAGLIYQAFTIPSRYLLEISGTLGLALLVSGICLLAALGLYKLGRLFVKLSSQLIHLMVRRPGKPAPEVNSPKGQRKYGSKRTAFVFLIVSAVGLTLFSISGMPLKFFTIFNSMKPEHFITRTVEFDPGKVNKISLTTAHSCIKLTRGSSDKITVSYEQPEWMDYELSNSGSMLSFYEKSNGRFPLFRLITLHESRTELAISIPEGYSPDIINVESTGGFVYITGLAENINVKTYSGSIFFNSKGMEGSYNIEGITESGAIDVNGTAAGQKTGRGFEYYKNTQSNKTINIQSSRGSININ
jgi:Predicted membrane protein